MNRIIDSKLRRDGRTKSVSFTDMLSSLFYVQQALNNCRNTEN